ncbi:MAG: aminoglycoside phosphotransferase family protein [Bacteroidales bacterium]|nr:aminoglycoside phosphotransferase family protein [Bacteroidales bacterium]
MDSLKYIAGHFGLIGNILEVSPLGEGLINDTYIVRTDGKDDYVLQRINHAIFKDVELLQRNIELVTSHIRARLEASGENDIERKVLEFIRLKDSDRTFYHDGSSYWRVSRFIKDSVTVSEVTPESSRQAGIAFGEFQAMLADLPHQLGETIPDFHNMELRARQLAEAVETDAVGRCAQPQVQQLLVEMNENMYEMCKAERMHREGLLPKRICHCDTKVSNMLYDKDGKVLCVIDLDTVMPSFVFSDYGDFLRTAANNVAEDCPQIDQVEFDMEVYTAFTEGYLQSASGFLTDVEKDNLPYAVALFPFMQAVRFLTDYINGDTYYKTAYSDHNLVRACNQMALFRSVVRSLNL